MKTTRKRRSMRSAVPSRALLALSLLATACGSTRRNEPFVEDLSVVSETTGAAGVQTDPSIESRLAMVDISSRDVGGLKTCRFNLRNTSDEPVDVSWTVDWLDRNGDRITPARRTWQRVQLKPGEETPIEITAQSRAAASWRLVSVDPNTLQP